MTRMGNPPGKKWQMSNNVFDYTTFDWRKINRPI
jgi:hypothetical protein